jgi:hypothetical protein
MTRRNLLDGRYEGGLCPLKPADIDTLKQALVSRSSISRAQWHAPLGHPSSQVVQSILRLNNIVCPRDSKTTICNACQLAKRHQLSYSSSIHQSMSPLELIYSDCGVQRLHLLGVLNTTLASLMISVNFLGYT